MICVLCQSNLAMHLGERRSGLGASHSAQLGLMRAALGAAVPLKIADLQRMPWSMVQAQAKRCAGPIGWNGDQLLFRGRKVGRTAELFVDLVTGIAALAFGAQGVSIFRMHFHGVHRGAPATPEVQP